MSCEGACVPCCNGLPPQPFVQVCMTCPPPGPLPTCPCPVKPLQLPCPPKRVEEPCPEHFYNNYNVDYRRPPCPELPGGCGKNCEDYMEPKNKNGKMPGCPTGFKPCSMKLTPPPCCNPCGVWCAQIQPCPPKPRVKKNCFYDPGPCTRPCCLHKCPDPPCIWDCPCKAHCYNSPPGLQPGRCKKPKC